MWLSDPLCKALIPEYVTWGEVSSPFTSFPYEKAFHPLPAIERVQLIVNK